MTRQAQQVYLLGYPGPIGGANTESWHTVRLWRQHGVEVTAVPMWKDDPEWRAKLEGVGCRIHVCKPRALSLPPGTVCVGFCNSQIPIHADQLRECRIIYVPCMNYLTDQEGEVPPFDRYVFQSRFQQACLQPQLEQRGVLPAQCRRIRGAFIAEDFPFRPLPHKPGEPFIVGRLSRGDPKKWPADLWQTLGRVPNVRARVMGWTDRIARKCGPPPAWAEVLPPCAETPQDFLASLHCLICQNDREDHPAACENNPRVGLEAMAAGVPIVAENRGGWSEMLDGGRLGLLCGNSGHLGGSVAFLASDESWRLRIATAARMAVVDTLAAPGPIWERWRQMFTELGA